MARPQSIRVKDIETPHMRAPAVKKTSARMRSGLRPNACDKLTKFGWKRVERRRNEVPAQNASTAVPLRSLVMA
jgi:hypothetical protein